MLASWMLTVQPKPLPHALGLPGVPAMFPHRKYPQAAWAAGGFIMSYPVGYRGSEAERFWSKVKITDSGCWEWTGGKSNGYGRFALESVNGKSTLAQAHVWAYVKCIGPIPPGIELHHECLNKPCVNPSHLRPLSKPEHCLLPDSAAAMNAAKILCKRGHIDWAENDRGWRLCLTCRKMHNDNRSRNPLTPAQLSDRTRRAWVTRRKPLDPVAPPS